MMNLRNSIALIRCSRFGCTTTTRFRWGRSASKYSDRAPISSYGANNFTMHHSRHSGVVNPSSSRDSLSSDAMPRLLILTTNKQPSLYRRHQIKSFQRRAIASASPPPTKQFSPKNKRENNEIKINDVIIIGGGPTGLFLSNLLTSYQISSHLLFDKRPVSDLLKHPQAHFINVRSMEILKAEVPRVYNGIVDEMPNVEEWEGFNFGGSVLSSSRFSSSASSSSGVSGDGLRGGRRMGRVIHPVREPLRVGQSGDAILVPHNEKIIESNLNAKHHNADIVSTCRPAHLAQNKFVSLLLDEARRRLDILHKDDANEGNGNLALDDSVSDEYLRYDEEVTHISESKDFPSQQPIITLETSKGKTYHTRYLVAADGVHSPTRKHYHIPMNGEASIQNLINVHFRTNEALSKLLMDNSTTNPTSPKSLNECNAENHQAMLHFIYNSKLVGVFVCHDGNNGEWVLQIPFFPPFQTMDDFTEDKVRGMIWAGLGIHPTHDNIASANNSNDEYRFDILSLRPWTMSSLVAQKYVNDSNTVVLAGDAAHAFPPAGGFGMNTGLQDAHNLAWRLALLLKSEVNGSSLTNAKSILGKYEQDRKPIASQNAALSVRNYQRTLRIAKACYLDAQHPQLLIKLLDSPPINFLPLQSRREMFRKLVQVAMMSLRSLEASSTASQSLHAKHIESNVRAILESGGSLPLVFPSFELGFAYDEEKNNRNPNAAMDTAGYVPRVKVGHRLPHVVVEILDASKDQNECLTERDVASMKIHSEKGFSDCISLADISSQLRQKLSVVDPIFNLLPVFSENIDDGTNTAKLIKSIADEFEINTVVTPVFPKRPRKFEGVVLVDKNQKLYTLVTREALSDTADNSNDLIAIIMVRPDGHVARVSWIHEAYAKDKTAYNYSDQIRGAIKDGLAHSIGHKNI